jgi:carbon monoxide dehydrogenase subunit G
MRYKLETTLQKPRAKVWDLFIDPRNTSKWQPTLDRIELLSGNTSQPGAVSELTFKYGEREFSLRETITQRSELEQLTGIFENTFAINTVKNTFIEQDAHTTLWQVEVEFKFKTVLMRIVGPFSKKRFMANTQRDMDRFRALVEESAS